MGVSLRERSRVADLVSSEYRQRREVLSRDPKREEIDRQIASLEKSLNLKSLIKSLKEAESKVADLRKRLADLVGGAKPPSMVEKKRKKWNDCECVGDYESMLEDIAHHLAKSEIMGTETEDKLRSEERRLLSKVELATSVDDLRDVLVAAKLVKLV